MCAGAKIALSVHKKEKALLMRAATMIIQLRTNPLDDFSETSSLFANDILVDNVNTTFDLL